MERNCNNNDKNYENYTNDIRDYDIINYSK